MLHIHVHTQLSNASLGPPLAIEVSRDDTAAQVVTKVANQLQDEPYVIAPLNDSVLFYDRRHSRRVDSGTWNLQKKRKRRHKKRAEHTDASSKDSEIEYWMREIAKRTQRKPPKTGVADTAGHPPLAEYWLAIDDEAVHVSKRWEAEAALPPLTIGRSRRAWLFPKAYASLLTSPYRALDFWFYRRDVCTRAFAFLKESVLRDGAVGWLFGPEGSSKTTTAMAFVFTQARDWVVTWVKSGTLLAYPEVRRFANGKSRCVRLRSNRGVDGEVTAEEMETALGEVGCERQHLVVYDCGFTASERVLEACEKWVQQRRTKRRLIVAAPVESAELLAKSCQRVENAQTFFMSSWTLDEYIAAVRHKRCFQAVEAVLDASDRVDGVELTPEDRVRAKFYFAGGNAMHMFRLKTDKVLGDRRDMNCIVVYTSFLGNNYDKFCWGVFSQYAPPNLDVSNGRRNIEHVTKVLAPMSASTLALVGGFQVFIWLAAWLGHFGDEESAASGSMFEACVLCRLRIALVVQTAREKEVLPPWEGDACEVNIEDLAYATLDQPQQWWKPNRCNLGGYNLLFIDRDEGLVRFVQISRLDHRDTIHWAYFHQVKELLEQELTIQRIEVFVLKPSDAHALATPTITSGEPLSTVQYVTLASCWKTWCDASAERIFRGFDR